MNEEEKQAIECLKHSIFEYEEIDTSVMEYIDKNHKIIYKLILNQQKEIEELKTITRGYEAYKCEEGDKIIIADKNFFDRGIFIKKFVSIEEYNLLLKRFRHLIKSKIISSYDKTKKGKYCKDISKFDSDYISKDKIKEKIKEVENRKENYTFDKLTSEDIRRTIITNLEELLGD